MVRRVITPNGGQSATMFARPALTAHRSTPRVGGPPGGESRGLLLQSPPARASPGDPGLSSQKPLLLGRRRQCLRLPGRTSVSDFSDRLLVLRGVSSAKPSSGEPVNGFACDATVVGRDQTAEARRSALPRYASLNRNCRSVTEAAERPVSAAVSSQMMNT